MAPARLVQLVLPGMRRRGGGRIVVVSSPLGEASLPLQGWYSATKRALSALCDALRVEVVDDAVDVVLVEPGAAATSLWDEAERVLAERRARSARPRSTTAASPCRTAWPRRAADPADGRGGRRHGPAGRPPAVPLPHPAAAVPFAVAARRRAHQRPRPRRPGAGGL